LTFFRGQSLSELILIQYGITLQGIPLVWLGIFSSGWKGMECHPWSLSLSAIVGTVTIVALRFTYFHSEEQPVPLNPGITGLVVNLASLFFVELCRRVVVSCKGKNADEESKLLEDDNVVANSWDVPGDIDKFGARPLTADLISDCMHGIQEPATESWFSLIVLCLSVLCTPITETDIPPLGDDGQLLWEPNVTIGLPTWAFRILVALLVSTDILLYAIWVMPDDLGEINLASDGSIITVSKTQREDMTSSDVDNNAKLLSSVDDSIHNESCSTGERS
jgi:hypothetical protein